ncbi:hypothetical protein NMY22_g4927 [Coprinellus aureogranulatus]|nr:hypothetical protein NMY22_g4927 [Coprinellus aureogranulatus]
MMQCHDVPSLIYNVTTLELNFRLEWLPSMPRIVEVLSACPFLRCLTLWEEVFASISADDIVLLLSRLKLDELHLEMTQVQEASQEPSIEGCLDHILTAAAGLQEEPKPLRSLTLPRYWESDDAPLTLLAEVARKVPYMESLRISIDTSLTSSNLPHPFTSPNILCPSGLKSLEIIDCRDFLVSNTGFTPAEYRAIARYIDACFPRLMSIKLGEVHDPLAVENWALVEQLRAMYQETRRLSEALARSRQT